MKIKSRDIIKIATSKYKLLGEPPAERINYNEWVKFIEAHKDYFVWYEDTPDGIYQKENFDEIPENFKADVLYLLNKIRAYSTNKIVKKPYYLVVAYNSTYGMVTVTIERKMTKQIAEIVLKMADFLGGKVVVNGNKILESIEDLE
jgi:hypothetical protein